MRGRDLLCPSAQRPDAGISHCQKFFGPAAANCELGTLHFSWHPLIHGSFELSFRDQKILGDNMKQRRISHSPLLDPAACSVLMMAPAAPDLASISPDVPSWQRQTYAAIATAAGVLDVPIFTLLWRPEPQGSASGAAPSQASQRLFLLEEYQCPWLDRAFVSALSSQGSSLLIVAGFWLEHEILGTALHALAASYDVAVLVDITPARHAPAASSARERLAQAGATPIVTSQLIREWMVAAPLGPRRTALRALLPATPST